jgi:2-polyprenyl-6-methoxyphenol hydroxylase-like FAD-dependent oxidoreductase
MRTSTSPGTSATERLSFVVVGAGIGGLATSIALRSRGHRVRTLERSRELRDIGHGITLWPNAIRVLRRLGCAEAVLDVASELVLGELRSSDGRVLVTTPVAEISRALGEPSVGLKRAALQSALRSALPAETIELNARCVAVRSDVGGAFVTLDDGRELEADVVIGADGIHSVVREALHGSQSPRYAGYTCWRALATFDHPLALAGRAFESWGPGARFGCVSIGANLSYWFCSLNAPPGGTDRDVKRDLITRFGSWHAPIAELIESTSAESIQRLDILDRAPRRPWVRGRLALLGDSAHAMTPNLGQGACLALEDALALALAFEREPGVDAALAAYERARYARAARIVRASRRLGWIGQLGSPALCAVRNACMARTPAAWMRSAFASSLDFDPERDSAS